MGTKIQISDKKTIFLPITIRIEQQLQITKKNRKIHEVFLHSMYLSSTDIPQFLENQTKKGFSRRPRDVTIS